ncbi:hypothetical protein E1212_26055 [Jiangella ureilytica]|uniref:Uncharacterized protein n=1 Tax=Jiangella ureilytica TaxID=2530374 RepID=A0A4R4RC30_9ACTN|nr:hypothetical protein [Jiangella ureilytica]TDC46781.1 hypothetical protein E1212_26055 [Jiangella ureilytica]
MTVAAQRGVRRMRAPRRTSAAHAAGPRPPRLRGTPPQADAVAATQADAVTATQADAVAGRR